MIAVASDHDSSITVDSRAMADPCTLRTGGVERVLNAAPDVTDLRDRFFEPTLRELQVTLAPPPPEEVHILDQMSEGACTGFALAAAINLQTRHRRGGVPERVSPRMLYEMARIHDEWTGEAYEGSSIRGAIKGFFHNGVCSEFLPRLPQTWMPSSSGSGVSPRFNAPRTLIVIPEECQSMPITAPKDWNQYGCARRRSD